MSTLIYSEIFGGKPITNPDHPYFEEFKDNKKTYQGEGLYQGTPSVFVRTFGCNLRCPKFNLPASAPYENKEVQDVIDNLDKYKTLKELPLVSTGCDTYYAIRPEMKRFNKKISDKDLNDVLSNLIDDKERVHLVITGGESLLGWQKFWIEFFNQYQPSNHVTFETNGTQILKDELRDAIPLTISASVKLSSCGEPKEKRIIPKAVESLVKAHEFYFKFVVSREEDFDEIDDLFNKELLDFRNEMVYIMPVGGTSEVYDSNMRWVAEEALKRNYKFSPRLHISLYGNQIGT